MTKHRGLQTATVFGVAFLAAVTMAGVAIDSRAANGAGYTEQVEISAPILPRVSVLYLAEGANFPTTSASTAILAHEAALTFDFLLGACAGNHPEIVTPGPGDPPTTSEQNAANYDAIATCAYQDFVSKPYWIPALVDQVDICATELGPTWRLISEDDLATFTDADSQQVTGALSTPASSSSFGNFYFSLTVWVRGSDGSLRKGDLSPGVATRVTDLQVERTSTTHYEAGLSLRCIRRTPVDAPL
jgi:hypothetical protein